MGHSIKRVAILGSTGSIGQQALDVIRTFKERFQVVALAGGRNTELLTKQVREFQPRMYYSVVDAGIGREKEFASMEDMASHPEVDLVIMATSGKAGLYPALAALRAGKTLALANKEVLVAAGEVLVREAKRHRARILPIDSEHSAIWQCLRGERNKIWKLYAATPGLEDGEEGNNRFINVDEQGIGGDRSPLAFCCPLGEDRGIDSPSIRCSFDGGVHRRVSESTARVSRHEIAHPVCHVLPRQVSQSQIAAHQS